MSEGAMMADIPKHLIDAFRASIHGRDWQRVAAVLGALRQEDAHLVPAWRDDMASLAAVHTRLDIARAEVERLTDQWIDSECELGKARADVERLREALIEALIDAVKEHKS